MKKARKRFVLYAMLSIFVLLVILLGVINGVNFTMASEDADQLTQVLAQGQGMFNNVPALDGNVPVFDGNVPAPDGNAPAFDGNVPAPDGSAPVFDGSVPAPDGNTQFPGGMPFFGFQNGQPLNIGPLGPNSPEMADSLRYFTFAFDADGNAERVAWEISAVTEEEALAWARGLLKEQETGWTAATYRYRVYQANGKTYVTVIDQGRELLPSYRILWISAVGLVVVMAISCAALLYIGKRLFKPLEEADRKQKRFIATAEKEFKVPLTVINANTEIIERENGETEQTVSINRQVKRMIALVKNLSSAGVFDAGELTLLPFDISALALAAGDAMREKFQEKGQTIKVSASQPTNITGDSEAMGDLLSELLENALKFSSSWAELNVGTEDGHVTITARNDTDLPSGAVDQVFDRFTRLENAENIPGVGLGLSHVKEIVQAHNGRASAKVADGVFTLRIRL